MCFTENREGHLKLSHNVFDTLKKIVKENPVSHIITLDYAIRRNRDVFLRPYERCTSFNEEESCMSGTCLIEYATLLHENRLKPHFKRIWTYSEGLEVCERILLTRASNIPVIDFGSTIARI